MPETTNKTAMMQLRDRLQEEANKVRNSDAKFSIRHFHEKGIQFAINLIDTELLAVEKQQIEQAYTIGYENINITAEDYYNQTFNTK